MTNTSPPTEAESFRKKPVVIQALRIESRSFDHLQAAVCWIGDKAYHDGEAVYIYTLEGKMQADVGDWIIRGVKGEHYPCKPDIFAMTYEPAQSPDEPPLCAVCDHLEELHEPFNLQHKFLAKEDARSAPEPAPQHARVLALELALQNYMDAVLHADKATLVSAIGAAHTEAVKLLPTRTRACGLCGGLGCRMCNMTGRYSPETKTVKV